MNKCTDYTFCELKNKTVVNLVDGKDLGHIVDVSFTCGGQIFGLIVPVGKKFFKNAVSGDIIFTPLRCVPKICFYVIFIELNANQASAIAAYPDFIQLFSL